MRVAFPDPPLAAAGIILRRPDAHDVPWITAACSDRELSRYIPGIPYPYSQSDARAFIEHAGQGWAEGTAAAFVIADAATGDGRGTIGLHLYPADAELAEVGYWLRREARGQGAATTAVRLVSGWAFAELGIRRLNLITAPENAASQRVAERAGFTREGLLRAWLPTSAGRRDSVMYSLLPDDLTTLTAGVTEGCEVQAGVGYGSVMEPGRLQITFDCLDPARVGTFWAAALAYPAPDVEGWHNFLRSQGRSEEDLNATFAIEDPAGVRPRMFFQRVHDPKSVKNRVHLDLAAPAADSSDRAEEIDAFAVRLTALGAHRLRAVKEDGYFVVMADPEGNEFCVD